MNRTHFQKIAEIRLRELLSAGFSDGAYCLAGYAVECALKTCVAKRTQEHDFPEKGSAKYYSHDLEDLLDFAKLSTELEQVFETDKSMRTNWTILQNWSEESHYERGKTDRDATDLLRRLKIRQEGCFRGSGNAGEFRH